MGRPWFGIMAHRDPRMFGHLVNALAPFRVIAHIDGTADLPTFEAGLSAESLDRVEFTVERVKVGWAGISVVHAMLELVNSALINPEFLEDDTLVFLSGACYPIKPAAYIGNYFAERPGIQYCRATRILSTSAEHEWKISRRHYYDTQARLTRVGLPSPAAKVLRRLLDHTVGRVSHPARRRDVDVFVGSQWIALTQACLAEIHSDLLEAAQEYRHAFAPDEIVFQTVVHNSKWANDLHAQEDALKSSNLRPAEMPNLHLLDRSMAKIYAIDDLNEVRGSDALFVRKVESEASWGLLEILSGGV